MSESYPKISIRHITFYSLIFLAIPIIIYLVGGWVDFVLNLPYWPPFPASIFVGFTVFYAGLAIGIKATSEIYLRGQGLPWGDAKKEAQTHRLVTEGLYAYTRNPMVLGYTLLPIGMGLALQSIGMTFSITIPLVIFNIFVLKYKEEPNLLERFGKEYLEYKQNTPFIIPNTLKIIRTIYKGTYKYLNIKSLSYYILSLTGVIFTVPITFNTNIQIEIPNQRIVIGVIFITICLLGMVAGIAPNRLRLWGHDKNQYQPTMESLKTESSHRGHHPSCNNFDEHVIKWGRRFYCAGCTGLVIGAAISVIGSIPLIFIELEVGRSEVFFWLGFIWVIAGILQHRLDMRLGILHISLNIIFVVGAFFLVIGVQRLASSGFASAYLLAMILFWIISRISLSRIEHERICLECTEPCAYRFT